MAAPDVAGRPESGPRRRVLETATRLFYAEGIHTVGIDRIIAEARVAKATFYKHFPSKDELVRAYVEEQDRLGRAAAAELPAHPPREMVFTFFDRLARAARQPGYRGCPFLNAAAEYPDPASPVRKAVDDHRRWNRELPSGTPECRWPPRPNHDRGHPRPHRRRPAGQRRARRPKRPSRPHPRRSSQSARRPAPRHPRHGAIGRSGQVMSSAVGRCHRLELPDPLLIPAAVTGMLRASPGDAPGIGRHRVRSLPRDAPRGSGLRASSHGDTRRHWVCPRPPGRGR